MLDQGLSYVEIARRYNAHRHVVRSKLHQLRKRGLITYEDRSTHHDVYQRKAQIEEATGEYKTTSEIMPDGTHKSDKLLVMSAEQSKDPDYLLSAHGYDKAKWDLISARSNIWNTYSKQDGVMTLYASKIHVKPKTNGWTFEDLAAVIGRVKPMRIPACSNVSMVDGMLEIPLLDLHFGVATYTDMQATQAKVHALIQSRMWREIFFIVGQDMLHADNFHSTTASGTRLQDVDMPNAWVDCASFYEPLIQETFARANSTSIMYSPGNHDPSMSWAFVQYLKARFPDAQVDDSAVPRKCKTFGDNFIGVAHGDVARRELQLLFAAEFPHEWAATKNREAHLGHLHREDRTSDIDGAGIMVRTLSTGVKPDKWHREQGYIGRHRRFQVFEWSQEALERIHYV